MSKKIVKVTEYTVKDGDTLEKIAKNNGLELADLCKFNFGTSDKDEVAKYYWGRLGCSGLKDDGSFKYGKDDKPGKLFIPDKNNKQTFAQDQTHEIKLKKPDLNIKKPTKCIVKFRPQTGWKGEFGFDWIRENDTAMDGDKKKYKNTLDAKNTYDELLSAYKGFKITKANDNNSEAQNSAAYINLFPADECPTMPNDVTIDAVIDRRGDPPASLKFYSKTQNFDTYIDIKAELEKSSGKHALKIKAKTATPTDIELTVINHTHDEKGKDEKIEVGKLIFGKNNKINRLDAKVVFVPVKTNINTTVQQFDDTYVDGRIDFLKKYCKQALVSVTAEKQTFDLTVTNSFWDSLKRASSEGIGQALFTQKFNKNWVIDNPEGDGNRVILNNHHSRPGQIHDALYAGFLDKYKKFKDYYIIFLFKESGYAIDLDDNGSEDITGLNGCANDIPGSNVVVFSSANHATVTHELFHAMGLHHTFDSHSKFQFEFRSTDNIMDYSHQASPAIERIATWYWQWKILKKTLLGK